MRDKKREYLILPYSLWFTSSKLYIGLFNITCDRKSAIKKNKILKEIIVTMIDSIGK